ncbi:MAG: hypothetical protein AB1665_03420 [Candidatus Thermoplasmatota archaeon]
MRRIPPVFGLVLRGYIVIAALILMHHLRLLDPAALTIFLVTAVSIAMLFGVGYLLVAARRPIKKGGMDIPGVLIVYVCGSLVMYFVSLLADHGFLPLPLAALLLTGIALALALFGVGTYLLDVLAKSFPAPSRAAVRRPR